MPKVKIYTTPYCPYCALAKGWLEDHGIEYEEIDVSKDRKAAIELVTKTGQTGVPVIEIDGKFIIGFDEAALQEALKEMKK